MLCFFISLNMFVLCFLHQNNSKGFKLTNSSVIYYALVYLSAANLAKFTG